MFYLMDDEDSGHVHPSAFTATNSCRPTAPGRYNVLPPASTFSQSSAHTSRHRTGAQFDQILTEVDSPEDATLNDDHILNIDDFIIPSVEDDTDDSVTVGNTPDPKHRSPADNAKPVPAYSYKSTRDEARRIFGSKQPDFCVKNSKNEKTRSVLDTQSKKTVVMRFRRWNNKSYGY